jgi:Methyltransferase FkbM domain
VLKSLVVNGVPKVYSNECGNDLWIREVVFPGKKNGYFVEAGAADGIRGGSCFFLERQLGWRGICIEPHDVFFANLCRSRPNSIHANVCLARENGLVDFVIAPAEGDMSPFLSGVRDVLVRYKHGGKFVAASGVTVRKPASTLVELLRTHDAPHEIEYGAFDIEGSEFEALRDFPFDEYRFLALSFEMDGSIAEPLSANGYVETRNPFNQDCAWEHYWLHQSIV